MTEIRLAFVQSDVTHAIYAMPSAICIQQSSTTSTNDAWVSEDFYSLHAE